ncbi:adenylylsulfate kinase [Nocardioides sp. Root1257]|uniref:adenylyl-sulfate kinase n=1 Tax=unclassified Nocardioides TaxID=2615069 RepID=UPI0006FF04DD|nr:MULTISPECIES: adenylyl-sulfate kinase [unclassified Nocardioides]KQW48551.1 adenylylsulfate kinase [Nocardioides sp. Root1257]KRC47727.1 adenylylsulfate kinase [Nocardioides sp. Root224]
MPTPAPPQYCPTPRELDDLELLASGALAPTTSFGEPGSPVTLALPSEVSATAEAAGAVEIVDPEGLPLARVSVPGGAVTPLTHAQYGPFRRLYLSPAQTREQHAGRTVVPLVDALTEDELAVLGAAGPVLLLALVGTGTPELPATDLIRATLAAADLLPDAVVVAVPLASHGDAGADHSLGLQVVANYAGPDPVIGVPDSTSPSPASIQAIIDQARPEPADQGLVLFFTGLSGSGKSTLARALMDRILEQGARSVTSLDGDVVRRHLSAGLTFSKQDRETNIRRIGWVAAEISRHGGLAVCSPIAPFDETRQQVRAMVEDAGGAFFLVHVATPLEECERRDRKGMYAKARRGEIPEFTGISSPYEEPEDADVRVDTTGRTIDDALDDVLDALAESGYLDLTAGTVVDEAAGTVVEEGALAPVSKPPHAAAPLNVLFVCTANICRSPYMELFARQVAGPDAQVTFSSAGTHGFRDSAMDTEMAQLLDADDRDAFRSRPLTAALLRDADLVLTAEHTHRQFILDDHPGAFRKVFTLGQFAEAARATDLAGRDLLDHAGEHRGPADPALDVPDPYRRGPEAAQACANQLQDLLRAVVPALADARRLRA